MWARKRDLMQVCMTSCLKFLIAVYPLFCSTFVTHFLACEPLPDGRTRMVRKCADPGSSADNCFCFTWKLQTEVIVHEAALRARYHQVRT